MAAESKGIVVDQKESGVRFAIHVENHDPKTQTFVRDLEPWETVISFRPKERGPLGGYEEDTHELPVGEVEVVASEPPVEDKTPQQEGLQKEESIKSEKPKPGESATVRKD